MSTENRNVLTNVKTNLLYVGIGILGILTVASCDKDNTSSQQGKIAISAKAKFTDNSAKSSQTAKEVGSNLVISDFLINVKEFELEFDFKTYWNQN